MTGILIRRPFVDTREEGSMTIEAEIRVRQLQAKEPQVLQQPPEARREA